VGGSNIDFLWEECFMNAAAVIFVIDANVGNLQTDAQQIEIILEVSKGLSTFRRNN